MMNLANLGYAEAVLRSQQSDNFDEEPEFTKTSDVEPTIYGVMLSLVYFELFHQRCMRKVQERVRGSVYGPYLDDMRAYIKLIISIARVRKVLVYLRCKQDKEILHSIINSEYFFGKMDAMNRVSLTVPEKFAVQGPLLTWIEGDPADVTPQPDIKCTQFAKVLQSKQNFLHTLSPTVTAKFKGFIEQMDKDAVLQQHRTGNSHHIIMHNIKEKNDLKVMKHLRSTTERIIKYWPQVNWAHTESDELS